MKRRKFLNSLGMTTGALIASKLTYGFFKDRSDEVCEVPKYFASPFRYSHRLPKTDQNYKRSRSYIEDDPIAEYKWASDKAYDNFKDIKYGVRIHWGIYSIWNLNGESWPFLGNRKPDITFEKKQVYNSLYKTWNPTGFDAERWMQTFQECGMKMFAFTTKHHEGFSLFDTKTRIKRRVNWTASAGPQMEDCDLAYSIMETPFKRDVVKELCDAAHKRNIKIDLYFSHSDWYDADFRPYGYHPLQIPSSEAWCRAKADDEAETEFDRTKARQKAYLTIVPDPSPEEEQRMLRRHRAQLKELLTNYGKIDMVCLDIWLGPRVWPQLRETLMELRKIQPDVMFRARGIGNYGDYYTPERFVPGGKENSDVPWFVIDPLGSSFSYDADPSKYKGAQWTIRQLIDTVSKGGNFMVGIGPDANGHFAEEALRQLKQVGNWLKKNGGAIYATRSREGDLWKEGDNIRFTQAKDGKTVFVHCFEWPGEQLVLKTVQPAAASKIVLLGNPAASVKWEFDATKGLVIKTPRSLQKKIPAQERIAYSFSIPV